MDGDKKENFCVHILISLLHETTFILSFLARRMIGGGLPEVLSHLTPFEQKCRFAIDIRQ